MKSYYGNLVVDIFELIFAFVSLLLVWVSYAKDSVVFFGISTVIYMLPRLLSLIEGILNNGRDILRLVTDLVALVTLLASFVIVCLIMFDYVADVFGDNINMNCIQIVFYVFSAISLCDVIQKVIIGIVQKFSVTIRNNKSKSILGGN